MNRSDHFGVMKASLVAVGLTIAVLAATTGSTSTSAASTKRPVPKLVGLPVTSAEQVIEQFGFEYYAVVQAPAIGKAGLVIGQSPPAGSMTIEGRTIFTLVVGVSYPFLASVAVKTCLVASPASKPGGVPTVPYPGLRQVPAELSSNSPAAWRAFGVPALIAPKNWTCTGFIAQDGGDVFTVVPPGQTPPPPTRSPGAAPSPQIAVRGEPACQACVAGLACAYFKAAKEGFPSLTCKVPARETFRRAGPDVVDFTDPPGVTGTGEPSGGTDPAVGALIYKAHSAALITCVLPERESSICAESVRAFTAYELAMNPLGQAAVTPVH